MGRLIDFLFQFFHFNKQERNGLLILLGLLAVLIGIRIGLPYCLPEEPVRLAHLDLSKLSTQTTEMPRYKTHIPADEHSQISIQYSAFDPNTISYEDALRLGFPPKTAHILVNFRNKGGKFRHANDLRKLYGLPEPLFQKLLPYIKLSAEHENKVAPPDKPDRGTRIPPERKRVELNSADSMSILSLKAIGPALTHRILRYRTMLGGFYTIDQLREVYGLRDSVIMLNTGIVYVDPALVQKIQVNAVEFQTLKKHPYFSFQQTQAVINFRKKHGKLTPTDLKNLGVFDAEKFQRILPYLDFN